VAVVGGNNRKATGAYTLAVWFTGAGDVDYFRVAVPAAGTLTVGTHYVAVVGGDARTQTGAYTLQVGFTAAGVGDDHGNRVGRATRVAVNTVTAGTLEGAGDVDYFRVDVAAAGTLTVETMGETDTYGYVRDGSGAPLGQDEETGAGPNFRVVREVAAGTYVVAVVGGARRLGRTCCG